MYGGYVFGLAFENSFGPDYVTEKVFKVLRVKSNPWTKLTVD